MKYILAPLTILLWFLIIFYGIYFAVLGMAFAFSLSWLWLIIGYTFLVGTVFGISNSISLFSQYLLLKVYGISWFSCIAHSLAGVFGLIQILRFYSLRPPELVIGDESSFFLAGMWTAAPFKTVFLAMPFIGLVISILWSNIIAPIYIKLFEERYLSDNL